MVVLQKLKGMNNSHDIQRWINHHLDLWDRGEYAQLVKDTLSTIHRHMPANQQTEMDKHVTKTFVNMLFQGKLQQDIRWLT
eukprot:4393573-Ditylum_brightwellii.AAC.1